MNRFNLPNLPSIRQDAKEYEQTFRAVERGINRIADQTGSDPSSSILATPPQISGIFVTQAGGIHDIQIQDESPAYNGIQYRAEYSQTPNFQNYHTIDMGESQNHRANLGAGGYYWRGASKYSGSLPSDPVYHGGVQPIMVGLGDYPGPPLQARQGFTGQYRNSPTPPVRK